MRLHAEPNRGDDPENDNQEPANATSGGNALTPTPPEGTCGGDPDDVIIYQALPMTHPGSTKHSQCVDLGGNKASQ